MRTTSTIKISDDLEVEIEGYYTPEENDGEATIELMEETERGWLESIWDNSIKN